MKRFMGRDKTKREAGAVVRGGLLKKLLLFIIATLIANAMLVTALFTYTSRAVYAKMRADELVPKAGMLTYLTAMYQRGEITARTLENWLNTDTWDAAVHVFGIDGTLLVRSNIPESEEIQGHLLSYKNEILRGGASSIITTTPELGIVVGLPVYGLDAVVTGAVFLTIPIIEVNAALGGLNTALILSSLIVLIVTLLPAYIGSRGFTLPLKQMSEAARAMATGNFSVRADENRKDEIGELGRSLNELSAALSQTIGDLMRERNRLQHVLDGLREGILAVDVNGNVTHCNPAAKRLLGCGGRSNEAALACLLALIPGADETLRMRAVYMASLEGVKLRVSVTELEDNSRRFGAVALIQDVTEEVRLEQTRREYVANVSHELRTPIASMRGLSEALSDGIVRADEDKQRYYGYILRESMRLSRLIDDLLELSRLQSGNMAFECRDFDVVPLLMELTDRFEAVAGDSGLHFNLRLPEGSLPVHTNADRVEQVLVCLLDNAVKYASDEGLVRLEASPIENGRLRVSVCNTGHIGAEHLPHLFERFYKADAAHAEQGTGLGLSIAKEIMGLLGEEIWAENCSEEACFRFTLRAAAAPSSKSDEA